MQFSDLEVIKNENVKYYQCINDGQTKTGLERKEVLINETITKANKGKDCLKEAELSNRVLK